MVEVDETASLRSTGHPVFGGIKSNQDKAEMDYHLDFKKKKGARERH
jgi:hypothetical protein